MHLKQDRMTARQKMDAFFAYEKPDRVPVGVMTKAAHDFGWY